MGLYPPCYLMEELGSEDNEMIRNVEKLYLEIKDIQSESIDPFFSRLESIKSFTFHCHTGPATQIFETLITNKIKLSKLKV
jgi:hypothetical protein